MSGGIDSISKEALFRLVSALEEDIADLKKRLEKEDESHSRDEQETYLLFKFMGQDKHRGILLREWIGFVYSECKPREWACKIVSAFHDETIDLSTIDCCKGDFKPW